MRRVIAITAMVAVGLELACLQVVEAQEAPVEDSSQTDTSGSAPVAGPQPSESGAVAEPQAPEASNEGGGSKRSIEEVVVTARRVEESQQNVPVAITALSAEALEREQINTAQDLQGRIPSLSLAGTGAQRNSESPTVRGQGASFGASPGVVMYYAEVPLPADFPQNGQGGPGKFFDIANMQLLKGSQGTLFGRNTTGGAILLEPHKPENSFDASLAAQGTNYEGQTYEGILNLPIIDDKLLMRAGMQYVYRDGFTQDIETGGAVDNKHYWTARLGLTWRPTDKIENYLLGYYTDSADNGTGTVVQGINSSGLNYEFLYQIYNLFKLPIPTSQADIAAFQQRADALKIGCFEFNLTAHSTNCGKDIVAEQQARGIRSIDTSLAPMDMIKTAAAIDQFRLDLTDKLALRNIASFTHFEHTYNWDADGSRAKMQDLATPDGSHGYDISQATDELQLQGNTLNDRLKYVVGGYYQRILPAGTMGQYISALGITLPTEEYSVSQKSYAPYAQGTYDLGGLFNSLEGLNLTAGLRYTTDSFDGSSGAGSVEHSTGTQSRALTYTAGLDYKLGTNLFYGKISHGYKAGGFSATAVVPSDYTFKPEYVTNYEIGQKSDFEIGDAPIRVNAALYYTDYTDMQRGGIDKSGFSLGSAIFTAGRASIYGLELETMAEPVEGFRLAANYAYAYGRYNQFNLPNNSDNPQLDCTGNLVPQGQVEQLDCVPFQATPRHQASLTSSYEFPVDRSLGMVDGSVTYAWTDRQYSSPYSLPEAEPGAWLGSFGLLNANLSWRSILRSSFDVNVFGTNLTDRDYRVSNSNVWNLAYYQSSIYGEPRIFGARLTYHWGT
jgi:iron complex outermembrane receptor protein